MYQLTDTGKKRDEGNRYMKFPTLKNTVWLLALALSTSLTAACGGAAQETGTVNVVHQWVSGGEGESFLAVVSPWGEQSGNKVNDLATRDLLAIVTTRVEGDNPPDIAALAAPGTMQRYAQEGELVALDSFLDMDRIRNEYSQAWIDLCTVDGKLYCIVYKAANKSTVWYDPKTFTDAGLETPGTWEEMIGVSDQLLQSGISPWSIGVESGGRSRR